MLVEKSSLFSGTPPLKACVNPMKGATENTSGAWDNDDFDDDMSMALSLIEGRLQPFKVEIPNYDDDVDTEKLKAWLDQLEMYFDLYNYSNTEKVTFTKLKLVDHELTWLKATLQTFTDKDFT